MKNIAVTLRMIQNVYSTASSDSYGGKVRDAVNDYLYPNGIPLNVLKGVYIVLCVGELVALGHANIEVYKALCEDICNRTGLSMCELKERIML